MLSRALLILFVCAALPLVSPWAALAGEKPVTAVRMGLVTAYEEEADGIRVTLDDGYSALLAKDDPIPESFRQGGALSPEPASSNNGIALLELEGGGVAWTRARLGILVSGTLTVEGKARSLTDAFDYTPPDPAAYEKQVEEEANVTPDAVSVSCMPAPSFYYLYLNAPFFRESLDCLYRSTGAGYGRGKNAVYRVDMAYAPQKRSGYRVILIQKSRFLQ